jgi:WD40 repeat protein
MVPPLTGPTNAVHHVAFSPDGHILAAGSADGGVYLWDIADRRRPVPLGQPLTGPRGYVYAVAFTPDGRILATANTDRSVWLWNLADPAPPATARRPDRTRQDRLHGGDQPGRLTARRR